MRYAIRPMFALLATVLLFAEGPAAQKPDSAASLLRAATDKAVVDGDLNGAIEQYQAIVDRFKTDRAVVATALLQMAECHQKLGDGEARHLYERLVREFADQTMASAEARERLAALQSAVVAQAGPVTRRIWDNVDQWSYVVQAPSADGRYVSFTGDKGDLAVRDVKEGTTRYLTSLGAKTGGSEEAQASLVSPDGRFVAYGWTPGGDGFDLRVLSLSGQSPEPRILHRSDETDYMAPSGWTPDGKSLLVVRELQDHTGQIAFVSMIDGSIRVLKSFAWNQMGAVSLSPDGRSIAYDAPAGRGVPAHDIFLLAADGSRETVVVQSPSSDRQPVWSPDGSQILFVSDRTGNNALWSVHIDAGKPLGSPELVRGDIGRLLSMTRTGALYYVTGGSTVNIYTVDVDANLKVTGAPVRATDRFVNGNTEPKWSRDGQSLAYRRGSTVVIRSVMTGEERVVPSELRAAQVTAWFPDGKSLLVLSHDLELGRTGFHRLDTTSGSAELLLSVNGRTPPRTNSARPDLSPDGKYIFYVDQSQEPGALVRFDIESRRNAELARASEPGRNAQFCAVAVSPDGAQLAFFESGWLSVISAAGGEPHKVFRRRSDDGDVSRWELAWSADQRYLLFVSDRDHAGVEVGKELWRVPVEGGQREKVGVPGPINFLAPQPGGRRITYRATDSRPYELWALENFLHARSGTK